MSRPHCWAFPMKNDFSLRPATAADQLAIVGLILRHSLNALDLRWQNFTVAQDPQTQFVGCGQIKTHDAFEELASLAVVDAWQGRGVAQALMSDLLARSGRPLWLMCESNLVAWYARHDFREETRMEHLPGYFRTMAWMARVPMAPVFRLRGTYLAFMSLG